MKRQAGPILSLGVLAGPLLGFSLLTVFVTLDAEFESNRTIFVLKHSTLLSLVQSVLPTIVS